MLFTRGNFDLLLCEDIETLTTFDDNGLLLAPRESLQEYVHRLQVLSKNVEEFHKELDEQGYMDLMNITLNKDDLIPKELFEQANRKTSELYDFSIDWVPGFFTDKKMGLLFAGCAMYSLEDFFAVFVIRNAFRKRKKWLIYSRTELIAHELCHIAHIGFDGRDFEEMFAYQTATSRFRRLFGGVLRSSKDTYLILGSVLFLLVAQTVNITFRSPVEWQNFPMPLIMAGVLFVFAWILTCYLHKMSMFRAACKQLSKRFNRNDILPIMFRCSYEEIREIAALKNKEILEAWLTQNQRESVRWRIIMNKYSKFLNGTPL